MNTQILINWLSGIITEVVVPLCASIFYGIILGLLVNFFYLLISSRQQIAKYTTSNNYLSYTSAQEFLRNNPPRYSYALFLSIPVILGACVLIGIHQKLSSHFIYLAISVIVFLFTSNYRLNKGAYNVLSMLSYNRLHGKDITKFYSQISIYVLIILFRTIIVVGILISSIFFSFAWIVPDFNTLRDSLYSVLVLALVATGYLYMTQVGRPVDRDSESEYQLTENPSGTRLLTEQSLVSSAIDPLDPGIDKSSLLHILSRVKKIHKKYSHEINRILIPMDDYDSRLITAILVYEDYNRPHYIRIVEDIIVTLFHIELTVGIAQIRSAKPLSVSESIIALGNKLKGVHFEESELTQSSCPHTLAEETLISYGGDHEYYNAILIIARTIYMDENNLLEF